MGNMRIISGICLVAGLVSFIQPAISDNVPVILRGKVVMTDGTPPPSTVALERVCSDGINRPGPLTNKKGEYIWRMDVDPMRTRACVIQVSTAGYASSTVDISGLSGTMSVNINLPPIVIISVAADPYAIIISESNVPLRAHSKFKAAMKALDAVNNQEAARQFQAAVQAAPKFAQGWHALGVLLEYQDMRKEAREAYEKAIESDSKLLPPYLTLVRLCIKTKDWECAAKNSDELIKADKKRLYPDVHLHRAVALYGLKDLDGAAASAQEAIRLDPNHRTPRAEYVLGRILEAKGDIGGAREHMSKYLELDKNAPDPVLIRRHLQNLGKPEASETEPELEHL